MTDASRPTPEAANGLFRQRFLNRTDFVAILAPWGKPCPVEGGDALDALIAAHVLGADAPEARVRYANRRGSGAMKGRYRVGSYCPGPDNLTRWLCLDFDGTGHADALADPQAAARATIEAFEKAGLPVYLERSGGGHGWHVWCFFDPPIAAGTAQALGRALAPKDAPLADGDFADPRSAKGIEVFPKQATIKRKGYGNLVWLPWWRDAAEGGNVFYTVAGEPYVPSEFKAARPEDVDRVLAELKSAAPAPPPPRDAPTPPPPGDAPPGDTLWTDWRQRALAALPIEAVYEPWLTGKSSGPGWLECRDPSSSTGDQNPSAGVADGTGEAERGAFHSFISGKTISVFDFLVERGQAQDFRAAAAIVAERSGVPMPTRESARPRDAPRPTRPQIRVNNRQLRDVLSDAWRAVHATNRRPALFVRSGALVRLAKGEEGPRIEPMDESAVYGYLARIANWVKVTEDAVIDTSPSKDAARDMLVYPDLELPPLEAVVTTPVFDRDGNLVSTPGYHRQARLWFHRPEGFDVGTVPERPTDEDVRAARDLLLDELFVDFPFTADSDRAHALAALFLPFVRRMVTSCTPIHLLEAPTPGTGKGLLADVLSIVTLGRPCEPTTITPDEDEARKKITSILARAQPMILIDNVRDGIESAQLASALTAEIWSDRILGQSRMIDLPNRATWIVTANNPRLSLEIARRCVRVRLDPKTDRPWERTDFKHTPLRDWTRANRARLVHAVLVIVRAWIAAGRPGVARTLGSFEGWAAVVGGMLQHAGIRGFLQDTEKLYEDADAEGQEWREFVTAWWEAHGAIWVASSDLLKLVLERDLLCQVVGDKSERSQMIRLGRALSSVRDRQFGNMRICAGRNSDTKTAQYRLIRVEAEPAPMPAAPANVLDLAELEE